MMRFYGLSDLQVLEMPARRFWALNSQIERLRAEEDLRTLRISGGSGFSEEGYKGLVKELKIEIGDVYTSVDKNDQLDRAGLQELKLLLG